MGVLDRLRCCKCLTDIRGFVFVSCVFVVFHQAVTSGLVSAVLSTLELRYGLTSVQSGTVLSTYNVAKLLMSIPMSYILGKGNIPVNMGICAFLVAIGCFLFSAAELFGEKYVPLGAGGARDVCLASTVPNACVTSETSGLYYLLLVGQGFIALGASAPYCIAPAYITNNVNPKRSLPLLGFFFAANALGPAVGFLGGGVLLGYWVDPSGLPPGFEHLTSSDVQWVGNWWLGILFCGVCEIAIIPFLIAFPAHLPDAPPLLEADQDDGKRSIRDVWRLLIDILTNASWWLVTLAIAMEAFAVSGYIGFGPKYVQTQFSLEAGTASILSGGGVVPAAVIGSVVGGWWDGKKHDKLSQTAWFNTKMALISTVFVIICVFMGCDNQPIYGFGQTSPYPLTIAQNCNSNCQCDQNYAPVCGADGVAYFSACWAGCQNSTKGDETLYSSCTCVFSSYVNSTPPSLLASATATPGGCKSCGVMLGVFFLFFFLFLLFTFMNHTPSTSILLRVVPSVKHKSLSLGLNDVIYKLLGSIPGPLIFGATFDNNCILLTPTCDGSGGSCAMYDNYTLRLILLLVLGGIFKTASTLFNLGSIYSIRKQENLSLTSQRTSLVFPTQAAEGLDGTTPMDAGFLAEMAGTQSRRVSAVPRLSLNLSGKDSSNMLMTPLTPTAPTADPARRTSGIARGLSVSERSLNSADRSPGSNNGGSASPRRSSSINGGNASLRGVDPSAEVAQSQDSGV